MATTKSTELAQLSRLITVNDVTGQVTGLDTLPTQTGNTGKYLTTDGSVASWGTITQLASTDELAEGSTNLYYTDARVQAQIAVVTPAGGFAGVNQLNSAIANEVSERNTAISSAVASLVDSSPAALDTLNELAAALGDDPNFATTVSTQIGTKLDASSYTASDVLTKIKTVDGTGSGLDADLLDGQDGSYYLDWTNITNKPDPVITVQGDITGSVTLSDISSATLSTTLSNSGVTTGTYTSVTVDSKGRVTSGTNPTTLAGYGITDAAPSSHVGSTGGAHGNATTSVSGFMSSSDKTKLDNIATGATANTGTVTSVTGGSYLTGGTITTSGTLAVDATSANTAFKVVARDASGNFSAGTITATLNGNAAAATTSQYVSIGSTGSFSGQIPFAYSTGTNGQLLVDSDGGFTYNTSSNTMSVQNASVQTVSATNVNATNISANTTFAGGSGSFTKVGVGTSVPTNNGDIRASGEITAYYSSDENLKENIVVIDNALEKLRTLSGVFFDWKDEVIASRGGEDGYFVRKHDTGLIAQQVEKVLPEVVGTREDGSLAVKYEKMAGLIVQAINELADRLESLEKKVG